MKPLRELGVVLAALGPRAGFVLHSGAAAPSVLSRALADAAPELPGRRVFTLMPCGEAPFAEPPACDSLELCTFLPGGSLRGAMGRGRVLPLRHALSEVPALFERGELAADAVLLRVSPPDNEGRVSLGVAVDYMPAALAHARCVVAEIDPGMPRTRGASHFHASCIDWYVDAIDGPHEVAAALPDEADRAIARHVASLVEDGDVLQLGVGALPDRVLAELGHLKHLGLHTGIVGDAVQPLIERGVIDNRGSARQGVSVATMVLGTAAFYRFIDDNPAFEIHPCAWTHGAQTLCRIERLCAINSALQVDLDGRVNAEGVGSRRISLPGGLPDFARAAAALLRGKSIVALRAASRNGSQSNIVERFGHRVPVTLGPDDVDFVVTEYGVAALDGCTAAARRTALAAVAHPQQREALVALARAG